MKKLLIALSILLGTSPVFAQSEPGWIYGFQPTTAQWATQWSSKMDYLGAPAFTTAGGTLTGKLTLSPSAAAAAGINCGAGSAPSSPVDGDVWCTTSGVFARINGSTIQLGGSGLTLTVPSGGTGQTTFTANRPLIGNGASAIAQGTVTSTNASTLFATASGTPTNGNCASWSNGNVIDFGSPCSAVGAGAVSSAALNDIAYYTTNPTGTTVGGLATCNAGYIGTDGSGVPACRTSVNTTLSATITAVGTVATGTWQGTAVAGQYGGTGVANTGLTITLAGNLATAGANPLTLTTIGSTNVTLPTSGNLMNQNGTSGGVPFYNTTTTVQSSALLSAGLPVLGGGAGSAPSSGTTTTTNSTTKLVTYSGSGPTNGHCGQFDASGNLTDSGSACAGSTPSAVLLATLSGGGTAYTDTTHFTNSYTSYTLVFEQLIPSSATASNNNCIIQVAVTGSPQTSSYLTLINGNGATSEPGWGIPCSVIGVPPLNSGIGVSGTITMMQPNFGSSGIVMFTGLVGYQNSAGCSSNCPIPAVLSGFWNSAAVVNGIKIGFTNGSGTFTSSGITSGTVKIYGNS